MPIPRRQPSLFDFRPTERLRNSGLTPEEERLLLILCLAEDYPRSLTIERTGTKYTLNSETDAALLYKKLRRSGFTEVFGTEIFRKARRRW